MNILIHICCSNCTLFPYRLLTSDGHLFTGYWFNPNIHPDSEYTLRLNSLKKLAHEWQFDVVYEDAYTPDEYFRMYSMTDDVLKEQSSQRREGGYHIPPFPGRCKFCYRLRLEKTAQKAKELGFDAFSTTLLISPYQDHDQIISTAQELASSYHIQFYHRDFRPYFQEAMALSKDMGLYRQKYCGCLFSKEERETKRSKKAEQQRPGARN